MPILTPARVRQQIEAGTPDPIYLILGEDEVEKSVIHSRRTRNVSEHLSDPMQIVL